MPASPAGALRQCLLSRMQRVCKQQAPLLSSDDALPAAIPAVLLRPAEGACQPAVHLFASDKELYMCASSLCTMLRRHPANYGMHRWLLALACCCR